MYIIKKLMLETIFLNDSRLSNYIVYIYIYLNLTMVNENKTINELHLAYYYRNANSSK